jgi:hypothetical protein
MTPDSLSQIDPHAIRSAATADSLAACGLSIVGEAPLPAHLPLLGRLCLAGKVRSIEPQRMIHG